MESRTQEGANPFEVEDKLYSLLSSAQSYLVSQDAIASHISDGIFSMTLARKQKGVFIAKPEDLREEFHATSTVTPAGRYQFELSLSESSTDILQICALPPPSLRKAQKEFRDCLQKLLEAQQAIVNMRLALHDISPSTEKLEETFPVKLKDDVGASFLPTKDLSLPSKEASKQIKDDKVKSVADKDGKEDDEEEDSDDEDGFDSDLNINPLPEILDTEDEDEENEDEE